MKNGWRYPALFSNMPTLKQTVRMKVMHLDPNDKWMVLPGSVQQHADVVTQALSMKVMPAFI